MPKDTFSASASDNGGFLHWRQTLHAFALLWRQTVHIHILGERDGAGAAHSHTRERDRGEIGF